MDNPTPLSTPPSPPLLRIVPKLPPLPTLVSSPPLPEASRLTQLAGERENVRPIRPTPPPAVKTLDVEGSLKSLAESLNELGQKHNGLVSIYDEVSQTLKGVVEIQERQNQRMITLVRLLQDSGLFLP